MAGKSKSRRKKSKARRKKKSHTKNSLFNSFLLPQRLINKSKSLGMTKYCPHCDTETHMWADTCHICLHSPEESWNKARRKRSSPQWNASWKAVPTRAPRFYEQLVEASPSKPKAFECFNQLPLEIRLQIWRHALPGPRTVYIYPLPLRSHQGTFDPCNFTGDEPSFERIRSGYGWRSPSSIDIVYVCREAYDLVSNIYARAFGTDDAFPQTWFNFDIDTLYLDWSGLDSGNPMRFYYEPNTIWSPDFVNVHRLASYFEGDCPFSFGWEESIKAAAYLYETIELFSKVTDFTILHRRYESQQTGNLTMIDIVDIDSLLSFCSQPFDPTGEAAKQYNASWGRYYWQLRRTIEISKKELCSLRRRFKLRDLRLGEEVHSLGGRAMNRDVYDIPTIEYKLVTTSAMAARIEKACKDYRSKRIDYERSQAHGLQLPPLLSDDVPPKQENE